MMKYRCVHKILETYDNNEKRLKHKYISICVALLILALIIFTYLYFSSEKFIYGVIECDGGYEITTFRSFGELENGRLEIPAQIDGIPVTSIGESTFEGNEEIQYVIIPNSIKKIGDFAFKGCENLLQVEIPEGVETIGWYAFKNCKSLKLVNISDSVISIGLGAFEDCNNLKKITLPFTGDGGEYTNFGYIFGAYSHFSNSLYVPNNLKQVTFTGHTVDFCAFYGCSTIERIVLTDKLTTICESAFSNCTSLRSIVIPKNVSRIDAVAFFGCENLIIFCESLKQPSEWHYAWNLSNHTVIWGYDN